MRLLLLSLALSCSLAAPGQKTEGVVQYDEKINMHRNLPPDAEDMRAMVPEYRTNKNELLFNETESLYHNIEPEEEEDEEADNGGMVIKITAPEAIFYNDYAARRKTHLREFLDQRYLIQDTLSIPGWKITGQTKTLLGYNCLQALYADTLRKREITAWFTDAVPVPAGPVNFIGLPGLVLEANVNNGEMIWLATRVEFRKLKKNEIGAPAKGEKRSQAEFDKMVEAHMKANGGRGIRIIRN